MPKKYCAVLGCPSNSDRKSVHFFTYPKVTRKFGDIGRIWKEFTRRKHFQKNINFSAWKFCNLHFDPNCYSKGETGRHHLKKGSVPTIYYRNGEKVVIPYNSDYQKYYGPEAERLFEETENSVMDHGKELINLRYKTLVDLKNLCRFCFSSSKDTKCIDMSAFTSYSVDGNEMLRAVGCTTQFNASFSDIICELCFLKVIEFHNFRKECSEKQKEILKELDELDRKIHEVEKVNRKSSHKGTVPWYQVLAGCEPDDFQSSLLFSSIPVINDETFGTTDDGICQVLVKNEQEDSDDEADDFQMGFVSDNESEDFGLNSFVKAEGLQNASVDFEVKDVKIVLERIEVDDLLELVKEKPKKPKKKAKKRVKKVKVPPKGKKFRERLTDRKFECFYCREKILGRETMLKHKCDIKFRTCEVPECYKKLPSACGYANHLIRAHNLPKVCKHYCPGCKTYYQMNIFQFQEHTKGCVVTPKVAQAPIKCEICAKICENLEAYTEHKLFHGTQNKVPKTRTNFTRRKVVKDVNKEAQSKKRICDLCGKILSDNANLQKHKQNVHLVDFTGEMYYCDLCPVKKPTKLMLYYHMKSVHIINWNRCSICSKDFKSNRLLSRHMLYIHERHRLNIRCKICPDKPGFNATVYLEQHMRKHHGENSAKGIGRFRCDLGFCESTYSTVKTLNRHKMRAHGEPLVAGV